MCQILPTEIYWLDYTSTLQAPMRNAILFATVLFLTSCSKANSIIILNRSQSLAIFTSHDPDGNHNYTSTAGSPRQIEWKDRKREITIFTNGCTRKYRLNKFYSRQHEWKDSQGALSRRYILENGGRLKILMPSAKYAAYKSSRPMMHQNSSKGIDRYTRIITHSAEQCRNIVDQYR